MISKYPSFSDQICRICGPAGFEDFSWLRLNEGWERREWTVLISCRSKLHRCARAWARLPGFPVDSASSMFYEV